MFAVRDLKSQATRSLILAIPESSVTAGAAERLQRAGWRVYRANTNAGLRRLACRHHPEVVVLQADGSDESGWLTCAKLLRIIPRVRVIVVGEPTVKDSEYARFIGAEALVPADFTAEELTDRVAGAIVV